MGDTHGQGYDSWGFQTGHPQELGSQFTDPYTGYPVSLPSSTPYSQDHHNPNFYFNQGTSYDPAAPPHPPPPPVSNRSRSPFFSLRPFSRPKKTQPSTQYSSIDPSPPGGDDDRKLASKQAKTKTKTKKKKRMSQYTWTVEFCAVALSLAAVITTVALLIYADGLPLVQYNFIISFNAVVSILGAIARVSLGFAVGSCLGQGKWNFYARGPGSAAAFGRFEDASRGPWGSLWLVVAWFRPRMRLRHHWAVAGAVVMVLLLGFEPFLQSVIYYNGVMEPVDSSTVSPTPSVGRSAYLDAGVYYVNNGGLSQEMMPNNGTISQVPFSSQPDLGMISALFNGFYNRSSAADLTTSFVCPSGNCTWAPFTSIATCSACNDVTDRLEKSTETGANLGTINYHAQVFSGEYLKYSLPHYANLSNAVGGRIFDAYMAALPQMQPMDTISFRHLNTMLAAVGVVRADDSYRDEVTEWNETAVTATECALWLCTNAYASEVQSGALRERVLASWAVRDMDSYRFVPNRVASADEMEEFDAYYGRPLWVDRIEFERSDLGLRIPADDDNDEARRKAGLPGDVDESFAITQRTIGSTMKYIHSDFFRLDDVELLVWPLSGDDGATSGQPPVTQALFESTDLSATFDNAARSLSNWMRDRRSADLGSGSSYGDPGSHFGNKKRQEKEAATAATVAEGTGLQYVIRIRVNWAYLSLPAATIVAGCLFVLFSVLETRRLGLEPWKTDVMASLLHSLDPETRARLRMAEVEEAAAAATAASGAVAGEGKEKKGEEKKKRGFHKVVEDTIVSMEEHGGGGKDGDDVSGGPQLRTVREFESFGSVSGDTDAESGGDSRSGDGGGGDDDVGSVSREELVQEERMLDTAGYEYQTPEEYSAWEYRAQQQQQQQQQRNMF